jgi:hypothetical protein
MWPFDNNNQQAYQQYAQAYDSGDYSYVDPNQAAYHLQQFTQNAPPDLQQQIFQQHFGQMPYEQRVALAQHMPQHYNVNPNDPFSMAQGFMRLGKEHPNILQNAFGHPLLMGAMVGLTAVVAKHMIDNHERHAQTYGQQAVYGQNYGNNQFGNNQFGNNPRGQDQYMQQELNQEEREVKELRRELRNERQEERREEEYDEERPRHHRREDY